MKIKSTFTFLALFMAAQAFPCTRFVYKNDCNQVLTARTLDWQEDMGSNIWVFPRGMHRTGVAGPNSLAWDSKYGSVITTGYDICSADGMNEKGLSANLLWLTESEYPPFDINTPAMSVAVWPQYLLDNFASVAEAVEALSDPGFIVLTDKVPGMDKQANFHVSLSDGTGDNAILEYIDGKLNVWHDPAYTVLTNSPEFSKQLAVQNYGKEVYGLNNIPGSNLSSDRFIRTAFYLDKLPVSCDSVTSVGAVLSLIRNSSVPFGISTPDKPNISTTQWRTIADNSNKRYFFESTLAPNLVWMDIADFDLSENAKPKKYTVKDNHLAAGNISALFVEAEPFGFAGLP